MRVRDSLFGLEEVEVPAARLGNCLFACLFISLFVYFIAQFAGPANGAQWHLNYKVIYRAGRKRSMANSIKYELSFKEKRKV